MHGSARNIASQQISSIQPSSARTSCVPWGYISRWTAQRSVSAQTQRRRHACRTTLIHCSGSDAGPPVAALSTDADAAERRDEYNRRMQQQMGWEDANPYEYHYGGYLCLAACMHAVWP